MHLHTKNKRERELTMVNKCTKNYFFFYLRLKTLTRHPLSGNEMIEYCYCKTRPLKILTVSSCDASGRESAGGDGPDAHASHARSGAAGWIHGTTCCSFTAVELRFLPPGLNGSPQRFESRQPDFVVVEDAALYIQKTSSAQTDRWRAFSRRTETKQRSVHSETTETRQRFCSRRRSTFHPEGFYQSTVGTEGEASSRTKTSSCLGSNL